MSATDHRRTSRAVDTLVHAFHDDPLYRWLVPDAASRPAFLRDNFALILRLAADSGAVHITTDAAAVAVWTEPGIDLLPDPSPLVSLLQRWAPERVDAALAGMASCQAHLPPAARTLHLLAVHPQRQGRGVAAELVQPVLHRCDQEGTAAYLESSNAANLSFYRRCGFEVIAEVTVPGGGPIMRPMRRHRRVDPHPPGVEPPLAVRPVGARLVHLPATTGFPVGPVTSSCVAGDIAGTTAAGRAQGRAGGRC